MDFYTNLAFKVQKGRGLGSRDPISKFWDPLITFEWIQLSASNLVQRCRTDPYSVRNIKRPLSGHGLGHVTKIRNFGTPSNFWTKTAISLKFGAVIEDRPSLWNDRKTVPKWAWPGSRDLISIFWDPLNNFWTKRDIHLIFGTDVEDGPSLRMDYKTTPKWAWPGHAT